MAGDREPTSMTVSLPATPKDYVRERANASWCSTPSEHIRRLIHADQETNEREEIERKVLAGLDSPSREVGAAEWRKLRSSLRAEPGKSAT